MRSSSTSRPLLAALVLASWPLVTAAQPTQEFTGKVDVNEVLLDVVVTDRDGNVILGLQPEDFVVSDGEAPVEVRSATFYSNRAFLDSAALHNRLGVSPDDVPW